MHVLLGATAPRTLQGKAVASFAVRMCVECVYPALTSADKTLACEWQTVV
jgi:hypothetical protein